MPIYKDFRTIPQLYKVITEEFSETTEKPIFRHKVKGKYTDISCHDFRKETDQFSYGLAYLNIKRGDKIAIISENRPEWVYSDFGIINLGAVDVPLYPILTADSIQFILNNSESKAVIVSNQFQLNKILKVRKKCRYLKFIVVMNDVDVSAYDDVYTFKQIQEMGEKYYPEHRGLITENYELTNEDELCTIIYTSGTTGEPKGVMLSHKNILSNVKAAHEAFSLDPTDTFLSFLPLCHIFERTAGYYTAIAGGSTIAFAEGIEKLSTNFLEVHPTVMTAVPRFFERLYSKITRNIETQSASKQKIFNWALKVGHDYAEARKSHEGISVKLKLEYKLANKLVYSKMAQRTGGKVRFFISGGAALSRDLGEFFEAIGFQICEGYGLTESSPVLAANRVNDCKFGSVGKPFPGVEIKIAKDGEILASGPNIMQGYYKNKKETEAVLKNGWLHTGDIGVFDAEGFLIITDRKKHLFKTTGGKYIAPTPIENMFSSSKFIDQFVLIGDKRMYLTALIVPDFDSLKEYADANRIKYEDIEELVKLKQINELLEKEFSQFQKKLANFERIRKFTLLEKPFTIEGGEITPSLKLKRKVIEERYSHLIDDMYETLKD
ncbi:MAG: long-chain fatty acid--CoA ligase [Rhodothermaceae bacterium]